MKRCKIVLDPITFHNSLGLPNDVRVIGFDVSQDPPAVSVLMEGLSERFEDTLPGMEAPLVTIPFLDGFGA